MLGLFFFSTVSSFNFAEDCFICGPYVPYVLVGQCGHWTISAINDSFDSILHALNSLHTDVNKKGDARLQAVGLVDRKWRNLSLFYFCGLQCWRIFYKISKALQDRNISLSTCSDLYQTLSNYVKDMREKFDKIEPDSKSQLPGID